MNDRCAGVFASEVSSFNPQYSVVYEDDGAVAYAYQLRDKKIISEVWHYNHGVAPVERPWVRHLQKPPFANPREFVEPEHFPPVLTPDELSFHWSYTDDGSTPAAVEVWIRNRLHARIAPGSKPGWSRLAAND